ncbi:hypothetical protein KCU71_g6618, partial [Aureobasidium melanogenum]
MRIIGRKCQFFVRVRYACHQLGTVRHLNIRHVITQRKPSEVTNIERSFPKKTVVHRHPRKEATVPHSDPSDERTSAALQHHKRLDRISVNKWRSNLILPPDAYWQKWENALKPSDAGGLDTALMFVDRWKDALPKSSFRVRRHEFSNTGSIFECTSHVSLALLGVRTVVSYGYNKQEAFDNQHIARVSQLYQLGELDTIYRGTIESRKLIGLYEYATKYGLFPRFDVRMFDNQPDAQYQITLAVPKWNVKAVSTAPTYIEALATVIKTYRNSVKKDDVRIPLTPEATSARLEHLSFMTANRALRFLTEKLQPSDFRRWTKKFDTPGPQWAYRIAVEGCYNPEIPMLRKRDAHFIGTITAVVRILQRFGFELIDGFGEHLEAAKTDAVKSEPSGGEEEVEIADQSHESSFEQGTSDQILAQATTPMSEEMSENSSGDMTGTATQVSEAKS